MRIVAALILAITCAGCAGQFFHPVRATLAPPAGLRATDVRFRSADNTALHGWLLSPKTEPKGTVLFLHGNAGNIAEHVGSVAWLVPEGYAVFLFDYRGYGMSEGEPTIAGVHLDAEAALSTILSLPGATPDRLIVFGQSLGGSVAVATVARSPLKDRVRAVVVEGAFSSYRRILGEKLLASVVAAPGWLLTPLLVDDSYSAERNIGAIAPLPVVVIHGTNDSVVPFSHGERLSAAASDPKGFWIVRGGEHIDAFSDPKVRKQFVDFLESLK